MAATVTKYREFIQNQKSGAEGIMLFAVVPVAIFFLFFFLGFAESHWIAPAVLFIVATPLVGEFLWPEPTMYIIESLLALLAFFYASFAIGRFLAPKKKVGSSLLGRRR